MQIFHDCILQMNLQMEDNKCQEKKVFIQIYKKTLYGFTKLEREMLRKGERLYKLDVMCIFF